MPLALLGLRAFHDSAVIEMGMRGLGQIRYLCEIAEPDVGVVVNAGVAHVGVVGSVDNIARGKSEIFERLPPHGCAVLPAGDPRLRGYAEGAPRVLSFGEEADADVRLAHYAPVGAGGSDVTLAYRGEQHVFRLPLVGKHSAIDAACAAAAAIAAGLTLADAARGMAHARPERQRSQLAEVAGRHVLIDCYNANPTSMAAALDTLAELRADRAGVAVIGDMLELGDDAPAAHEEAGRRAAALGLRVIALGDLRDDVLRGAGDAGQTADDPEAAARAILSTTERGDWVLVKASRGMRLERVVEALDKLG